MVIMRAIDDELMMGLTQTERLLRSCALSALGALFCLCFSLGAHSDASLKAALKHGFSGLHKSETRSTDSPPWEPAKSIAVKVQGAIPGAMRAKHLPPHPANLPPERFTGVSFNSSYSRLNNIADIRSRIFLSPLQDRAPPRFA